MPLNVLRNLHKFFSAIYCRKYNLYFQPFIGKEFEEQIQQLRAEEELRKSKELIESQKLIEAIQLEEFNEENETPEFDASFINLQKQLEAKIEQQRKDEEFARKLQEEIANNGQNSSSGMTTRLSLTPKSSKNSSKKASLTPSSSKMEKGKRQMTLEESMFSSRKRKREDV